MAAAPGIVELLAGGEVSEGLPLPFLRPGPDGEPPRIRCDLLRGTLHWIGREGQLPRIEIGALADLDARVGTAVLLRELLGELIANAVAHRDYRSTAASQLRVTESQREPHANLHGGG
ncbi:MAG: hypothetical protein WBV82_10620 [Myxococcaceae bacterium]